MNEQTHKTERNRAVCASNAVYPSILILQDFKIISITLQLHALAHGKHCLITFGGEIFLWKSLNREEEH